MTEFRQLCPSCKRILALPVTAVGQLAQCPACNATFTAGEQTQTVDQPAAVPEIEPSETGIASGPSPSEFQAEPETGLQAESPADLKNDPTHNGLTADLTTEPTEPIPGAATPTGDLASLKPDGGLSTTSTTTTSTTTTSTTTTDPIGSEFETSTPTEAESGEPAAHSVPAGSLAQYPEGVNPFSIPLSQASSLSPLENPYLSPDVLLSGNFARRCEVNIVNRSIGEILRTTWVLLLDRGIAQLASILCILFVVAGVLFFAMICMGLFSVILPNVRLDVVAFILGIPASTLIVVVSCRNSIAIVRNTPNLMSASMPTFKAVLHVAVPFVLVAVVAGMFRSTVFGDYLLDAPVMILTVLCTAFTCGWFWISIFLCCDMQSSGLGSLLLSVRILYHNMLTTAVLIVISSFLTICGIVSCGILLLITQPVTQMMLATAYLMMTNQPIADPRDSIETA